MENDNPGLSLRDKAGLLAQRFLGWITFPFWGGLAIFCMRFIGRYKIQHLREIRRQYQEILKQTKGPVILCANHLTKIDSALITWSLASVWFYFNSFRCFAWNLPERNRYFGNFFLRLACYLGSCVPIDRGGPRNRVQKSLNKIRYLLKKGYTVSIFPEGKRSLSGKIDGGDFSYGVGQLIKAVKNVRVLCIYVRGYGQKKSSGIPKFGEKFYINMTAIQPRSIYKGIRATKDLAQQVMEQLQRMEERYFALCR